MKKRLNIILMILIILSLLPSTIFASNGNLNSIENKAIIKSDGTVSIEQLWEYDDRQVGKGTEHFIDLKVLYSQDGYVGEDETITDYKVYLNDKPLEFINNWNIDGSFNEKAGKYGIVEKGNSVELCFGITDYEVNKFRVEYTVHNAVKETVDGNKYLHWTFTPIDLNPEPRNLMATIETNGDFIIDKIYGFNYKGQVSFDDMARKDKITAMMSPGSYTSSTVLNVFTLIKDDNNVIMNTKLTGETLDNKLIQIFKGSDYDIEDFNGETQQQSDSIINDYYRKYNDEPLELINVITTVFFFLFTVVVFSAGPILFVVIVIFVLMAIADNNSVLKDVSKEQRNIWCSAKDFYRREEPDEILNFYPVLEMAVYIPRIRQNILLYFISKWTSEEVLQYVRESEEEVGLFRKKATIIKFKVNEDKLNEDASSIEKALLSKFTELTTKNNMLNTRDLDKLDISEIEEIFNEYRKHYKPLLESKGYVTGTDNKARITEAGIEVINQHAGLKNFLRDFTLIKEKEASEIKLWDYYFHMAAFYGMTDVFKKQLDSLPSLNTNNRQIYNRYYGTNSVGALNRNISQKMASNYSSYTNRSSGGGGSSSSGGGGGSSGGGSGGGTR